MKRFISRLVMLVCLMTYPLIGSAVTQAYYEEFTTSSTTALPTGWTRSSSSYWKLGGANSYIYYQTTSSAGNGATMTSPMIDISMLNYKPVLRFSMWQLVNQGVSDVLVVKYRTTADGDLTVIDTISNPSLNGAANEYVYELPTDLTQIQLVLEGHTQSAGGFYIDYLILENSSKCTQEIKNLQAEKEYLTVSSALISWSPATTGAFVGYDIKVSSTEMSKADLINNKEADVLNSSDYTSEELALSGLQSNTTYYVYVRTNCGEGEQSAWAEISFTTPCALSKPTDINLDFETELGECYTTLVQKRYPSAAATSSKAAITKSSLIEGENLFYFYAQKDVDSYLFFPALDFDAGKSIKDYQISFTARGNSATYRTLYVGVADAHSPAAITQLHEITLPANTTNYDIVLPFADYQGTGSSIVIYALGNGGSHMVYIDNVKVENYLGCATPLFASVDKYGADFANIKWNGSENSNYNILFSTKELTTEALAEATASTDGVAIYQTNISGLSFNSGAQLTPGTTYYVYIQGVCNTQWAKTSFTTNYRMTIPFAEPFNTSSGYADADFVTANYTTIPSDFKIKIGARTSADANQAFSTTYKEYLVTAQNNTDPADAQKDGSLYMKSGTSGYVYMILPELPQDVTVQQLALTFYLRASAAASATAMTGKFLVGVSDKADVTLATGEFMKEALTIIDTLSVETKTTWEQKTVYFRRYTGTGKYIVLLTPNVATEYWVDDINIDYAPSCLPIRNLTATATDVDKVMLQWEEQALATSWNIKVSRNKITDFSQTAELTDRTVSTKLFVQENLNAGDTIYAYVRPANCDVEWQETMGISRYAIDAQEGWYNDFSKYELTGSSNPPYDLFTGNYINTPTTSNVPYVYATAWNKSYYTGTECTPNSLLMGGTKGAYVILPKVINGDVKDVNLTFWFYYENSTTNNKGELFIGVVEDPLNVSETTITDVATVSQLMRSADFHQVSLSSYQGTGKYIILYIPATSGTSPKYYLDNITVLSASQPQQVTEVEATATTANSITLDWKENGVATNWNIRVFTSEVDDPDQATPIKEFTNTTSKPLTITGLEAATLYYVYVQSNQGSKGNGAWSSVTTVWTQCEAVKSESMPWTFDFNFITPFTQAQAPTQTILPPCINIGFVNTNTSSTTAYYPIVQASATQSSDAYAYLRDHTYNDQYGSTDYNILRFNPSTASKAWIILPETEEDIKNLQLRFYGAWGDYYGNQNGTSYGGVAEIGVYEGDDENGQPIFTYTGHFATVERGWNEGLFYFDNYTGSGKRIAIVVDALKFAEENGLANNKNLPLNIDDIEIKKAPSCRRVTDIFTTALDSIGATISWTKAKDETAWNVKVSTSAIDAATVTEGLVLNTTTTQPSVVLTGLTQGTTYYVYVQSKNAEEVGDWSKAYDFKTLWSALELPYSEDFEAYDVNEVPSMYYHYLGSDATDEIQTAKAFFVSAVGTSGSTPRAAVEGSLRHFNIKNSTKDYVDYFVMPAFKLANGNLADVRDLQITYKLTSNVTVYTPVTIGVMSDPNKVSTFVPYENDTTRYSSAPPVWSDCYHNFKNFKGGEDDTQDLAEFKYIAFRVGNRISNATSLAQAVGNVFIDNIEISEYAPCPKPAQLMASNITNSSVDIAWTTNISDPEIDKTAVVYNIRVFDQMPENGADEGYIKQTSVTGTLNTTIDGLNGNTLYYIFVSADCTSDLNSGWSSALTIRTECNPTQSLPFVEDFEGLSTELKVPYCWTVANSPVLVRNSSSYNYAASGNTAMSLPSTSSSTAHNMLISPKLDVEKLSDITIHFNAAATSYSNLKLNIYAVSEAEYGTSLTAARELITTVDIPYYYKGKSYTHAPYMVSLSQYVSTNDYKYIGFEAQNGQIIIDDIYFVSNTADAALPILDLQIKDKADTWVTYQFNDFDSQKASWEIEYGTKGFEQGTGTTTVATNRIDTLKGLAQNTEYDLYIRRSAESQWQKLSFQTAPTAAVLPESCQDDFADASLWTRLQGKVRDSENINNSYVWYWRLLEVKEGDNYNFVAQADIRNHAIANPADATVSDSAILSMAIVPAYYESLNSNDAGQFTRFPLAVTPSGVVPAVGSVTTFFEGTNTMSASEDLREFAIFKLGYGVNCGVEQPDTTFKKVVNLTPGLYKILYRYYNKQGVEAGLPPMLKSVSLSEYNCVQPTGVKIEELKDTEATFSWQAGKSENFEVVVAGRGYNNPFALDEENMYFHQIVEGQKTCKVTGLESGKEYSFYVRTMCLAEYTDFAELPFKTVCPLQTLPLVEEFNEMPDCWLRFNETSGLENSINENYTHIKTITDYDEAGQESNIFSILVLQSGTTLAIPATEENINNLKIEMSIHAGTGFTYNSELELGIMDPRDANSFQSIATYTTTENHSLSAHTPYHFDKISYRGHKLQNVDNLVFAVRPKGIASSTTSSIPTWIDYIKLSKLPQWLEPENVQVLDITSTSATFAWTAANNETAWKVKVGDEVYDATQIPFVVSGLTPDSLYQVSVASVYEGGISEYTEPIEFMTGCGVYAAPYIQDFKGNRGNGAIDLTCWDNYITTSSIEDVFAGNTLPQAPAAYLSNNAKWYLQSTLGGKHAVSTEGTAGYRWLISPNIEIADNTHLSFGLARTAGKKMLTDFYVAISLDGGQTWKEEDAQRFSLLTFDVESFDIPQIIDLSKYAGKTIRVAFYHGVNEAKENPSQLHLGNIRFNCLETINYSDKACEGMDYEGEFFYFAKEELVNGVQTYKRFAAANNSECDSLITLTLETMPIEYETVQEQTCPGMSVIYEGEEYELPEGYDYVEHTIRTNTQDGCYKIVTLQISKGEDCIDTNLDNMHTDIYLMPNVAKASQILTISGNTETIESAQVFDARGAYILQLNNGEYSFEAPQTQGMYMLRITLKSGKTITERFVVR